MEFQDEWASAAVQTIVRLKVWTPATGHAHGLTLQFAHALYTS